MGWGGGGGGGGQHFEYFRVLTFVGVLQLEPMHGFSPNFQDMLTGVGLGGYQTIPVAMAML